MVSLNLKNEKCLASQSDSTHRIVLQHSTPRTRWSIKLKLALPSFPYVFLQLGVLPPIDNGWARDERELVKEDIKDNKASKLTSREKTDKKIYLLLSIIINAWEMTTCFWCENIFPFTYFSCCRVTSFFCHDDYNTIIRFSVTFGYWMIK